MTTYPANLQTIIKLSQTPVFAQVYEPASEQDCPNCAGLGNVYIFVTATGPFRDPPGNTLQSGETVLKSVDDPMYGWVWYTGKLSGGVCPTCNGIGRLPKQPVPVQLGDTARPVRQLVERFEK